MSLQLNTQVVSTIIAINVVTVVVAVSLILCLGCCIFACYRRHMKELYRRYTKPVKCTYCKLDIVNETIEIHLNKCLEYRNSKLRLAEPFRPGPKQAFTEVVPIEI